MIWSTFGSGYCNDDTYVSWMIITVPISDPVFIKATNSEVKKSIHRSRILCHTL